MASSMRRLVGTAALAMLVGSFVFAGVAGAGIMIPDEGPGPCTFEIVGSPGSATLDVGFPHDVSISVTAPADVDVSVFVSTLPSGTPVEYGPETSTGAADRVRAHPAPRTVVDHRRLHQHRRQRLHRDLHRARRRGRHPGARGGRQRGRPRDAPAGVHRLRRHHHPRAHRRRGHRARHRARGRHPSPQPRQGVAATRARVPPDRLIPTRVSIDHRSSLEDSMAWKVVVDFDLCESNAICMGIAPEVFEVRDDNFLYVLQETPPDSMREACEQAVRQCPKQAISIADD